MKNRIQLLLSKATGLGLLAALVGICPTQAQQPLAGRMRLHTDTLFISERKTTSVAFAEPIMQLDRGTADLLVQRSKAANNLLHVKAAMPNFIETNLTVLVQDGTLHNFIVCYRAEPKKVLLQFSNVPDSTHHVAEQLLGSPQPRFAADAKTAMQRIDPSVQLRQVQQEFELALRGIFIRGDQMYFHFYLRNHSYIPFDVARLALQVHNRKQVHRSASQELEVEPLFLLGDHKRIESRAGQSLVLVTPKITLPPGKELQLQIWEHAGGRHQRMRIKNKQLRRAIPLINY